MDINHIIFDINKIFIKIFQNNSILLTEFTTVDDVEEWDSLNHIQIITALESYYNISFDLNELLNFNNIGDLSKCILGKL